MVMYYEGPKYLYSIQDGIVVPSIAIKQLLCQFVG